MIVNTYLKQMVETATPVQLISLLFKRGSELMEEAEQALVSKDLEKANEALTKAQRIVAELISSLDMEKGGELAVNLHRLYTFVWERLLHANLLKSVEPLKDARTVWDDLQQLWQQVEASQGGV